VVFLVVICSVVTAVAVVVVVDDDNVVVAAAFSIGNLLTRKNKLETKRKKLFSRTKVIKPFSAYLTQILA